MDTVYSVLLFVCLCGLHGHVGQILGPTAQNAKDLKKQLFETNEYDVTIRPVINQYDVINISVEFFLLVINSVDEVSETLKTTGYLRMYWTDEFLVWDSANYGGLSLYHWPQNLIWKPDVALKNSYQQYKQLGDSSLNVEVASNGQIVWSPFQVFESTCAIDITYFPYDEQTCSLIFVAWSYSKTEILMEGGVRGIVLAEYETNSAWEVTNTWWYEKIENIEASIVFVMTLKRKPLYNMLTLVFPVIVLAILNLFVFALPSSGGEKAGYAVTVFLAFAVFLTIMEASFPQNSDTIAVFAIYVVIETVQSTLITVIALFMIRCCAFDENTKVPSVLIFIVRLVKCQQNREHCGRKNKIDHDSQLTVKDLELVKQKHNRAQTAEDESEDKPENIYTWEYVMNGLDLVFFIFFTLSFLITTFVCLFMVQFN